MRLDSLQCSNLSINEINIGPVNEQQRKALFQLLHDYRDRFAHSATDVGCGKSAQIEIVLNDQKPFTYRPYRLSISQQDIIKKMIGELLDSGIIRETHSPYASPILLVKKKNGEKRMCIDYQKLNSMTVKEQQPLPRIDDQIDRLHGRIYFTSLNLRSGYYQVLVITRFWLNKSQRNKAKHYIAPRRNQ